MTSLPAAEKNSIRQIWRDGNKQMIIGGILLAVIILLAVLAPVIVPNDPYVSNPANKYASSSLKYWFGTDNLGRCMVSRVLLGAHTSLAYASVVLSSILFISFVLGLISGYFGGMADTLIMRVTDIFLALPAPVIALAIAGALGPSAKNLLIAMVITSWGDFTKLVRGMVLEVKERDFIMAARASGFSHRKIIVHHIFTNIIPPMLILATLEMGKIILAIAGYSFIGLGAQPPTAEWGAMISDAKNYVQVQPQLILYPSAAVVVTVVSFNLFGDGLKKFISRGTVNESN
ncbi:ABC transporter permease subunit [Aminipila butyrica]|uniref:ABC transporter permease subunit n=1 Tax=Aminipila butyrica TaxID=433296 RepID=A0A858BQI0_9FIRM|nr:ABC transporter permease subunit [Aminipila butyrica]QIB68073.1 ABC transporter permease subunit [Aminipila butyrica]